VSGTFHPDVGKSIEVQGAGIVMTDGKNFFRVERATFGEAKRSPVRPPPRIFLELPFRYEDGTAYQQQALDGPALERAAYLRLERQGNDIQVAFSEDGTNRENVLLWVRTPRVQPPRIEWPHKVKVGVVAHNTFGPGTFRAEFSDFKLSKLKK
jgi:hypothetical protein